MLAKAMVTRASATDRRETGARTGHLASAEARAWTYHVTDSPAVFASGRPVRELKGRRSRAASFSRSRNPSAGQEVSGVLRKARELPAFLAVDPNGATGVATLVPTGRKACRLVALGPSSCRSTSSRGPRLTCRRQVQKSSGPTCWSWWAGWGGHGQPGRGSDAAMGEVAAAEDRLMVLGDPRMGKGMAIALGDAPTGRCGAGMTGCRVRCGG
jgi:hypothetical protein